MTYVISDLHGCHPDKVTGLFDRASFSASDDLFILGDVIDRGDYGIDLLKMIMKESNMYMILGNHEAMMSACSFIIGEITDESVNGLERGGLSTYYNWLYNGGQPTVDALSALPQHEREAVFDFVFDLPLYECATVGERDFIFTHSGLGGFSKDKKIADYSSNELLWTRPMLRDRYYEDVTVVFGHTPTRFYGAQYDGHAVRTDTWINADAGCACGNDPVMIRLDDMVEFSSEGERMLRIV